MVEILNTLFACCVIYLLCDFIYDKCLIIFIIGSNLMAERENLYFFSNFKSERYDITYTHDVECM